jgi:type I restriction enzyme, R subunit
MSQVVKDAAEKIFQENFVRELETQKWQAPDFLDGNRRKVTVNDLIAHWRSELNRLNSDQLEGVELTDNEFSQVMAKVNQLDNSYQAAKLLAMEESKGKIDGIYRDDNPLVTRKQITLTIFKKAQVRGGDSSYRIAREVQTANGNRFDLVLLINGLPLINIELKRTDKNLDEAFEQFKRYYRDGEYRNNFMAFSQMMVITSEIETRYFATPKTIDAFNSSFVFHWSNKFNKPINHWQQVIEQFLMIPMAHQMVGDYLVIDEAKEEENRRHMLMRPYQVSALQAVEGAALGWDNPDKKPHGGFVWHTTGSGKTITSFKTALFLSTRASFDKVIFLVDRRELDSRTSDNFKAYAAFEPVTVDDTHSTSQLRKHLNTTKNGIVVTTIFKLHNLVKSLEKAQDDCLANKKLVFIVDEAHRSTMKNMMGEIKSYFQKNGLFFGFTGTPLFDENKVKGKINENSEVINTTEKLFGPKLHQYTIDEAIADGNVLGFHVDYINTGEFSSYEDLRDQLIERIKLEKPEQSDRDIARLVHSWSETDVEKQAIDKGILAYHDQTHIPRVVEEILNNWQSQSQQQQFNAILTVAYKERVIAYYQEFKKQLATQDQKINIAMTFSFGNENDPDNVDPDIILGMFNDYAEFTGIKFIAGDKKHGEQAYFEDVVERATRGGSGRNGKNIDLVIVADQLLTGYDSKQLNTLYVDRTLKLQNLIQAYSRTNRVFGSSKEFGTIINFQTPRLTEQMVSQALELYGSGGSSSKAIVDTYATAVRILANDFEQLALTLAEPTDWQLIQHDVEKLAEFIKAFKVASDQLNTVQQYYEYQWDNSTFGMTEHRWLQYVGALKNLIAKDNTIKAPIVAPTLIGKTKLAGTQVIDAAHILSLIGSKVTHVDGVQTVNEETRRIIYEQIQELSQMGDDQQAKILKEFVDTELLTGHLSSQVHFDQAFTDWKKDRIKNEAKKFANEWGIDSKLLQQAIFDFDLSQSNIVPHLTEIIQSVDLTRTTKKMDNLFMFNIALHEALPNWIAEIKQQFS